MPSAIIYDADKELNDFLEDTDLRKKIKAFDKFCKKRWLKNDFPLLAYAGVFATTWLILFKTSWMYLSVDIKIMIMLGVMVAGYIISLLCHLKLKSKLNQKLATSVNNLSEAVQHVLNYANLNPEYLSYLLECRIQERQRLDEQYNEMMKIISNVLRLPILLGIVVEGFYIHTLKDINNLPQSIISLDVAVIIAVILLGVAIDFINCWFLDVDYYRQQTILSAVNKFKIEDWDKDKTDC